MSKLVYELILDELNEETLKKLENKLRELEGKPRRSSLKE